MLIGLHCKCGKRIKVPEARIGTTGKCPACRAPLRLVAPSYAAGADDCQAALEVVAGPDRIGEVVFVGGPGPIEIGRHPERHLVLAGERVSRTHCRLVRLGVGWSIEDAKSTAGLLLNGRGVKSGALADGDLLQIGEYQLRYRLPKRSGARAHVEASPPPTESHARIPAPDASPDDSPAGTSYGPGLDDHSLLELGDGDVIAIAPAEAPAAPVATAPAASGGPVCPSCERSLAPNAKICVACGIDLKTGRAILTSHAADLDTVYVRTEEIVRWLSWIIWWGIYPVASEAFGVRKPYVIRAVAIMTVLTSVLFWVYDSGDSADRVKNYMLWVGSPDVRPLWIPEFYKFSEYGDRAAFETELARITKEQSPEQKRPAARGADDDTESDEAPAARLEQREQAILAAYKSLPPEQRCFGQYSPSQLITHAFLHGGILHLAGNLIFLLVIGSRVNALVGNLPMLVLYPVLAVAAAVIFMATQQHAFICPMVGASGAIMGLAGMYVVLMPVHNVHIASWMRFGLIGGFQLTFKLFAVRGFWLVLFYIGFDILFTVLGLEDGVAHWAHLGGFMAGAGIALVLLFTRLVNCRGGDIVSAILGRHAWSLIGKPDINRKAPLEYGW